MAKPYTSHEIAVLAVEIADYAIFELSKDPPTPGAESLDIPEHSVL
jgi:hypothetical protein